MNNNDGGDSEGGVVDDGYYGEEEYYGDGGEHGGHGGYGDGEEERGTTPHHVRLQESYNELVGTVVAIEEFENNGTGRYRLPAIIIGKKSTDSDVVGGDNRLVTTEWPAADSGVNFVQHQFLFVCVLSRPVKFKPSSAGEESPVHILNFCNCR